MKEAFDCMPKEQFEFISKIQADMLESTNMTKDEAWDFGFRCWQCGYAKVGKDINVRGNGWIPVERALPEENGRYIAYHHKWSDGKYLPKFDDEEIRILRYINGDWRYPRYCDTEAENDCHHEVLAWQPLPLPFKEG